jgi:light-regulated signal transduction histidine kinase (bacteriophytochrome)
MKPEALKNEIESRNILRNKIRSFLAKKGREFSEAELDELLTEVDSYYRDMDVKTEAVLKEIKNGLEKKVQAKTRDLQKQVDELNRVTAQLKEEHIKLEHSNEELEAFSYSISHDLRAPLRAIKGFSEYLAEDFPEKLGETGKRFIYTIRENAIKMDKLISDTLNLSLVSKSGLKRTRVDMEQIVGEIYSEMTTEQEKKAFRFIVHPMPPVFGDASQIKRIWQNLIGNALKYSSNSASKVIEIGSQNQNNETVFYIRDEGAGFSQNQKNKIFGVFFRLHREEEFPGTGVGLAIVERIVKKHGGKVWARGKINQGATFFFTIPQKTK